jgi:leader peptidase (prepilin peptidase)/N-methyltransferase
MTGAWISGAGGAVAGAAAGWLGRLLLGSLRRGVRLRPLWCEVSVAVLWIIAAVRSSGGLPWWWLPGPMLLGWLAVLLSACDMTECRLPDALTLPAYPAAALMLAWARYWSRAPNLMQGAVAGAVVFAGTYAVVRLITPAAMGPGDVKLAGSLGAVVGAVSVAAVLMCMAAAAVITLSQWALTRCRRVPHGPAMLAPAWLVTALAPGPECAVGRW